MFSCKTCVQVNPERHRQVVADCLDQLLILPGLPGEIQLHHSQMWPHNSSSAEMASAAQQQSDCSAILCCAMVGALPSLEAKRHDIPDTRQNADMSFLDYVQLVEV